MFTIARDSWHALRQVTPENVGYTTPVEQWISTAEIEQEIDSKEIGTTPSENEGQPHNIKPHVVTSVL